LKPIQLQIGLMSPMSLIGPTERKTSSKRGDVLRPVAQAAGFTTMEFAAFSAVLAMSLGVRFG